MLSTHRHLEPVALHPDMRLFFALYPPLAVARAIAELAQILCAANGVGRGLIGCERLHMTMLPCFAPHLTWREAVQAALTIGASLRHHPFLVTLKSSTGFRNRSGRFPFVLQGDSAAGLASFHAALCTAMRKAGFVVEDGLTPHVTLAWAQQLMDRNPIVPLSWKARDFALVASPQGQSRHIVLGRWSLQEFHPDGPASPLA